jgi:hypothetical protein
MTWEIPQARGKIPIERGIIVCRRSLLLPLSLE